MFARRLNLLGRSHFSHSEATHGCWRSPSVWDPSWWTGLAPWPPSSQPNRYLSVNFKPPDCFRLSWWQSAGTRNLCDRFPQAPAFHLSRGLMDRTGNEPPFKRRKSQEEFARHGARSSPSCHSVSPAGRLPSSSQNGPAEVVTSDTSPQQTNQTTEIKRPWEDFSQIYTRRQREDVFIIDGKEDQSFDFSVMSYNILSQDLLVDNAHLYKHCRWPVLEWSHRFSSILKEFEMYDADILCLQEVQEDHYKKQIKPSLESLGYHCEYKVRTGRKPDGCVIGFKQFKFSLVSCQPVEYFRHGIPLLDRDNVGLVLLLRPALPGGSVPSLCVANTHLLYNPRRGDIKLTQLAMLLAEMGKVARQQDGSYCPIILCGDFNSVPSSPLYSFIREGKLEYDGLPISKISGQEQALRGQRLLSVPIWPKSLGISHHCQYETESEIHPDEECRNSVSVRENGDKASPPETKVQSCIEHDFQLTSVYSHYLSGQPEITTCHSRTALTVDYIFYSAAKDNFSAGHVGHPHPDGVLQLLSRLCLLCESDLRSVNGLPNEHNPSDHLPLLARFRLRL
ncbi:protein angel homolog 2 isoform X2 [Amia ocellicauda]